MSAKLLSVWQISMTVGNIRGGSREEPELKPQLGRDFAALDGNKCLAHSRCSISICYFRSTLLNKDMRDRCPVMS